MEPVGHMLVTPSIGMDSVCAKLRAAKGFREHPRNQRHSLFVRQFLKNGGVAWFYGDDSQQGQLRDGHQRYHGTGTPDGLNDLANVFLHHGGWLTTQKVIATNLNNHQRRSMRIQ